MQNGKAELLRGIAPNIAFYQFNLLIRNLFLVYYIHSQTSLPSLQLFIQAVQFIFAKWNPKLGMFVSLKSGIHLVQLNISCTKWNSKRSIFVSSTNFSLSFRAGLFIVL